MRKRKHTADYINKNNLFAFRYTFISRENNKQIVKK